MKASEVRNPERLMRFGGHRIKTKKESVRTWSEQVADFFVEWIDSYRAVCAPEHDALWIARGGGPASDAALAVAMRKNTLAHLKVPVTPNRLRDAAATTIVSWDPEKAPLATSILGHSSQEMTHNYTETADQIRAGREAAALIAAGEEKVRRLVRAQTRSEIALNPRRRRRRAGRQPGPKSPS